MESAQAAIVWFTENGEKLAYRVREKLEGRIQVQMGRNPGQSLKEWCREGFESRQLLIFVGAVGIAVRSIAPYLQDKFTDPAVLVLDEQGRYVIPVLSGHVGGGNRWAAYLAEELSAVGVITTATDLNGKFAVDVFAAEGNLTLTDRRMAKQISAEILAGLQVGIYCEKKIAGNLPEELVLEAEDADSRLGEDAEKCLEEPYREKKEYSKRSSWEKGLKNDSRAVRSRIYIGIHNEKDRGNTLYLHPKAVVIGIGCKKGKTGEEIEAFVRKILQKQQIAMESVSCLASIDLKKDETGILEFAGKYQIPFVTFTKEQLQQAPGEYKESDFVKEVAGIGNVCERSAVLAALEMPQELSFTQERKSTAGRLILEKTAECGITLALAEKEWSVEFE